MLGEPNERTALFIDLDGTEKSVLLIISALIIVIGVYPQPLLHISEAAVTNLIEQVNQKILVK
jgi:NADH-quinone oxidoreductase subunit M